MKISSVVLTVVAYAAGMFLATGAETDGVEAFLGKWKVTMEFRGNEAVSTLSLLQKEDGTLTGKWQSRRGTSTLKSVKIKDGELSFTRVFNRQGQEFTIPSKAKIKEGKLIGTMEWSRGNRPFTGVRPKPGEEEAEQTEQTDRPGRGVDAMLQRLDTNGDGKIQEAETSERMQQFFGMIDSNGDGELDKDELEAMMQYRRQQQQN